MDRNEAVLRELNLYPQWKRRDAPAPKVGNSLSAEVDVEVTSAVAAEEPVYEESQSVRPEHVEGHEAPIPVDSGPASTSSARTEINNTHASSSVAIPDAPLDNMDWPELKQRVHDCTACGLRAGCTQTVFGTGDEHADWLFVGEGPGAEEDAQGEPFVGQSGKLLDNMLMAIHLKRGEFVYITNVVKCLPPEDRTPHADEIAQCLPYLQRQIELIKPKLIVALGKTAASALLHTGKETTLGSLRGTLHDYNGIPLVVTYHPAYLLRSPMEKAKAWQDLCLAVNTMEASGRKALC